MSHQLSIASLLRTAIRKAAAEDNKRLPATMLRKDLGRAPYNSDVEFGKSVADANRYQVNTAGKSTYPQWNFYAKPLNYFTDKRNVKVSAVDSTLDDAYTAIKDASGANADLHLSADAVDDYTGNPAAFNQAVGHEGLHSVQRIPSRPSMPPVGIYAGMAQASPRRDKQEQDTHQATMGMELEAAMKEYKPMMYTAGIDPYGPKASQWLHNAIKAKQASGAGNYLQHVSADALKQHLPLLLHILRGVASNNTDRYRGHA